MIGLSFAFDMNIVLAEPNVGTRPDRSWRARGISGDSLKSAKPDGLNGGEKEI
jgi:hypothetical protein